MVDKTERDVARSVVIAPAKLLPPIIAYAFLYPLLLRRGGADLLGLWSLYAAIPTVLATVDVGFSLHLTREASRESADTVGLSRQLARDLSGASIVYQAATWLVLGLSIPLLPFLGSATVAGYSGPRLVAWGIVMAMAVLAHMDSRLLAALLSAWKDNAWVQAQSVFVPSLALSLAVAGAYAGRPIEGLALGQAASALLVRRLFNRRLALAHGVSTSGLGRGGTWGDVRSVVRRGWHLYAVSFGTVVREPVLRAVVLAGAGLGAAGALDVAIRLTRMAREAVAAGSTVLFPTFAGLTGEAGFPRAVQFAQLSLLGFLGLGALPLLVIMAFGSEFVDVWLGEPPPGVEVAIRWLGAWNILTLFSIPFWFLLQVWGGEARAAFAVWIQVLVFVAIVPVSLLTAMSLNVALAWWLVSAAVTHGLILAGVQRFNAFGTATLQDVRVRAIVGLTGVTTLCIGIGGDSLPASLRVGFLVVHGVVTTLLAGPRFLALGRILGSGL